MFEKFCFLLMNEEKIRFLYELRILVRITRFCEILNFSEAWVLRLKTPSMLVCSEMASGLFISWLISQTQGW